MELPMAFDKYRPDQYRDDHHLHDPWLMLFAVVCGITPLALFGAVYYGLVWLGLPESLAPTAGVGVILGYLFLAIWWAWKKA